jgi:hypothetical protein
MNPRQIALVGWVGAAAVAGAVFVLRERESRTAAVSLVYGLHRVGFWNLSLWWDTAVFALVGTTVLVSRMLDDKDFSRRYYARIVRRSMGFSVMFGTFVSTYTFGLPIELILIPWLFVLGATEAVSTSSEQLAPARKLVRVLLVLTVLAMLGRAISGAVSDSKGFLSTQTVRSLLLLLALTISYLPYLFALRVWAGYQLALIPLKLGEEKPISVRLYARMMIILTYRLSLSRLQRFRTGPGNDLSHATSREAVDRVLRQDRTLPHQ